MLSWSVELDHLRQGNALRELQVMVLVVRLDGNWYHRVWWSGRGVGECGDIGSSDLDLLWS